MRKIDFEHERKIIDREITFFHFARAKQRVSRCIALVKKANNRALCLAELGKYDLALKWFNQGIARDRKPGIL